MQMKMISDKELKCCVQYFEGQTLIGWVENENEVTIVDLMIDDICMQSCVANIYSNEASEHLGGPFHGFQFDFSILGGVPEVFQLCVKSGQSARVLIVRSSQVIKRSDGKINRKLISWKSKRIQIGDVVEMVSLCGLLDQSHLKRQGVDATNILEFIEQYIEDENLWTLSINILFWGGWYSKTYETTGKIAPLIHYLLENGLKSNPNPLFDTSWFLLEYSLSADSYNFKNHRTPILEYLENYNDYYATHVLFDGMYYLECNQDVKAANVNPLLHFFLYGEFERRRCSPYLPLNVTDKSLGNPLIGLWEKIKSDHDMYDEYESDYQMLKKKFDKLPVYVGKRAPDREVIANEFAELSASLIEKYESIKDDEYQIDIVVPFFNAIDSLLACVDSLLISKNASLICIWLVNDGSTVSCQRLDKYKQFKNIKFVNKENEGYLKSSNLGAKQGGAEFLAIINSDVIVPDYFVDDMLSVLRKYSEIGVLAPTVFYPNGTIQEQGGYFNQSGNAKWISSYQKGEAVDEYKKVEFASGVAFFFKRSIWSKLGGYDENYAPAYCEDADLCIRLQKMGLDIGVAKNVQIWHELSKSYDDVAKVDVSSNFHELDLSRNKHYLSVINTIKLVDRHSSFFEERKSPKIVAFYLPQYHQIPENNKFWGQGFTEWWNVSKARPVFKGHIQPLLPSSTGFYDLNNEEVENFQFSIARKYGIDAFCYYFYWLNNKHILNLPLRRRINGKYKFPFCICWANENWTRAWDGQNKSVLLEQKYDIESLAAMCQEMIKIIDAPEYLTVNGKPLILIYNYRGIPNCKQNIAFLRAYITKNAKCDPYIALVESFSTVDATFRPADFEANALVSFAPHGLARGLPKENFELIGPEEFRGSFYDYEQTALNFLSRPIPNYTKMQCVMPGWDNTARRGQDSNIFANSSPGKYRAWLEAALLRQKENTLGDEQIVFVNAWNEWAEGAILEPSMQYGNAFLEATYDAKMKINKVYGGLL